MRLHPKTSPEDVAYINSTEQPTDNATPSQALTTYRNKQTLQNFTEVETASTTLQEIKTAVKELDTQRKDLKADILAAGRKIDSKFKPTIEEFTAHEKHLKSLIKAWYQSQQEKNVRRQSKRIEQANASGATDLAEDIEASARRVKIRTPSGVSVRSTTRVEITDKHAVPIQYLEPSERKLLAAHKSGQASIPGVRFVDDISIACAS